MYILQKITSPLENY